MNKRGWVIFGIMMASAISFALGFIVEDAPREIGGANHEPCLAPWNGRLSIVCMSPEDKEGFTCGDKYLEDILAREQGLIRSKVGPGTIHHLEFTQEDRATEEDEITDVAAKKSEKTWWVKVWKITDDPAAFPLPRKVYFCGDGDVRWKPCP